MKIYSLNNIIKLFLILTGILILVGLVEVLLLGNLYPYALLTALSILSFSSFLVLKFSSATNGNRIFSMLTILAIVNALLLSTFSFYTDLLKYCWNYSFGISILFPAFYVIQLLQKEKSALTNSALYLTLLTTIFFEVVLIFKLTNGWIFNILTALFGLVTLLTITYLVTGTKESKN
ncbi:MAG: hypothetical protein ACK50Y_02675 [Flavobacteriia bacterium]|jgi:hypothetical protein